MEPAPTHHHVRCGYPEDLRCAAGYAAKSLKETELPQCFQRMPHQQRFSTSRGFYGPSVKRKRTGQTGAPRGQPAGRRIQELFKVVASDGRFLGSMPQETFRRVFGRTVAHGDELTQSELQRLGL